MPQKLIVIIGITGNQGHSVATRFLADPTYRIRGLTRNLSSPTAQSLTAQGVELVTADLNDSSTLTSAFAGANLIFSVTNYWEPFFSPVGRQTAAEKGVNIRRYAYDIEKQQGINIADAAAATVDTLDDNGFIVSTLSYGLEATKGEMKGLYHFDGKAEVFPRYVGEKYPALAAKMSCVQTGFFMTSFRLAKPMYFSKRADGTYNMTFPHVPDMPVPHLDVSADTGNFVHAVSRMPPGKSYMCAGTFATWPEYCATWSKTTGVPYHFKEIGPQEMIVASGDEATGQEIADMFVYSGRFGYAGGDKLLTAEDLTKAGFECPMTTLEEFMGRVDWSEVLNA